MRHWVTLRDAAGGLFSVEHVDQPALVIEAEWLRPGGPGAGADWGSGDGHADTYGLQASARITGYTFNPLTGTYESLTLATSSAVAARTAHRSDQGADRRPPRSEDTAIALISASGSNTVYYQRSSLRVPA